MKKKLGLLFLMVYSLGYSYLQIYPLKYDKRIDNGGEVVEYNFSNPTSNKLRYLIYIEEGKNDMSKWMEYYPKTLILKPQEEKSLKVYISSPEGTPKGEYTAILGIKELPIASELPDKKSKINLLSDIKLEIAGFVGEEKPNIEVEDINFKKIKDKYLITGKIKNKGGQRGEFDLFLENSRSKEEYLIGKRRILAKEELRFSTRIEKNIEGFDTLIVKNNNKVIKRTTL